MAPVQGVRTGAVESSSSMTTDAAFTAALSGSAPTVLREVRPPQAPWPGVLVTDAHGLGVLVDADVVAGSFAYWDDSDGHVAVPRDVLLTPDGVRVVMPVCTSSLASLLRRWEDDPPPLGELVTAAVSVIRGAGQGRGDGLAGSWWLRDDGRPVFASGSDTTALTEASAAALAVMSALADSAQASSLLRGIANEMRGAEAGTLPTEEWEDAVFALAPASALSTTSRPSTLPTRGSASPPARTTRRRNATRAGGRAAHRRIGRLAPVVQRVVGRVRTVVPGGRGRWMLAAVAGALVLLAGSMWPTSDPPAESPVAPNTASDSGASTAPPASPAAAATHEAGVDIVRALVRGVRECPDAACRGEFWETTEAVRPSDLPDPDDSTLELVDDLGGVMVVRTRPPGGASGQVLVIVQVDDGRWRLRDVRPLGPTP